MGQMTSQLAMAMAATAVAGYLVGSVPWAYLIGRGHGIDIRRHGSGNVGATNVSRTLGRKWGVLCFALDFLKGCLPVLGTRLLLAHGGCLADAPWGDLLLAVAVFAPIAGHNWPVFLGFRGGKGVAVSAGALTALTPWAVLAAGAVWLAVFQASRYVSLASVVAAVALPILAWGLGRAGLMPPSPTVLGLLVALSVLVVVRHRTNLRRLLDGTESRFVRNPSGAAAAPPGPPAADPKEERP